MMPKEFTVWVHVSASPADVYEAVADPDKLSCYFTTGGAKGRAESGATVTWEFADFPSPFPVEIDEAVSPERIIFHWPANEEGAEPFKTKVTFVFEPVDDGMRTKVSVTESGWHDTLAGEKAAYSNCMGWSQMLMALKAWVEHGINLREGAYK